MTQSFHETDDIAFRAASRLAETILATLRMARALAAGCRPLDLGGLDHDIGRLCAASLDLPRAQGRLMRRSLGTVLRELDALRDALVPP